LAIQQALYFSVRRKSPRRPAGTTRSVVGTVGLTNSHARFILIAILALGAFLRFYQLTTVPSGIQVDEAMNGANILQILETGRFHVFYPENNGRRGSLYQPAGDCLVGDG